MLSTVFLDPMRDIESRNVFICLKKVVFCHLDTDPVAVHFRLLSTEKHSVN